MRVPVEVVALVAVAVLAVTSPGHAQSGASGVSRTSETGASRTSQKRTTQTPRKEDVNRPDDDGSTPLQWAVYNGDVAEVRRLLRAGADVSLANHYGATPMALAAEVADTDILK